MNGPKAFQQRGRLPAVRFPITREIVDRGDRYIKTIHENTSVNCVHCGQVFLINQDTAYHIRHPVDREPYIRCPHCGFRASDSHYFDQMPRPKRIHNPEDYKVKIIKPED